MTPAPLPVILACLAVAVTVSCDAGLVTSQRVHADRTSPLGYCSITGRAAGAGRVPGGVGWRSPRLWAAFWAEAVTGAAAVASG